MGQKINGARRHIRSSRREVEGKEEESGVRSVWTETATMQ